jgi:hypothetical protein
MVRQRAERRLRRRHRVRQGVTGNACQPEARCFFGAPLPFVNDPTSTCVINAIQDGRPAPRPEHGRGVVDLPLQSRVYLTGITYGVARRRARSA